MTALRRSASSDGLEVVVAEAATLVGKRLKVRVERVLDGRAYAVPTRKTKAAAEPLTAEAEAEKPTRKPPVRKGAAGATTVEEPDEDVVADAELEDEPEIAEVAEVAAEGDEAADIPVKRKTRRGSRGGRNRKKTPASATTDGEAASESETTVTIHLPDDDLGRKPKVEKEPAASAEPAAEAEEPEAETEVADGDEAPAPKKKTRRGSRGGRNRKKKPAAATNGSEPESDAEPEPALEPDESGEVSTEPGRAPAAVPPELAANWEYVPMSEWADEVERNR